MNVEQQKVLQTIQNMTSSFEAGDLDAVMSNYLEPSAIVFEPGQPVYQAAQQRAAFEAFLGVKPKFSYGEHEVIIAGKLAVHIAPWKMKGRAPDGTEVIQSGLSVAVLEKQSDGKWLMAIDNPHGSRLLDTLDKPQSFVPNSPAEEAAYAVIQAMTSAFEAGDLAAVMDTYGDPAAIVFEPAQPELSKPAHEAAFGQFMALKPTFHYGSHEVVVAGRFGVHITSWSMDGKTPEGKALKMNGLSVAVLQQNSDGKWRMYIDNPYGNRVLDSLK